MTQPTYACRLCGRRQIVNPDGRGFPPDIAKRKLIKGCEADGCKCDPQYTCGISPELLALIARTSNSTSGD